MIKIKIVELISIHWLYWMRHAEREPAFMDYYWLNPISLNRLDIIL